MVHKRSPSRPRIVCRWFDTPFGSCHESETAVKSQVFARTLTIMFAVAVLPRSAESVPLRAKVVPPPVTAPDTKQLGYMRSLVTRPAVAEAEPQALAFFVKAVESPPLPEPEAPEVFTWVGLRLVPGAATCAVDGSIRFENKGEGAVTFLVGDAEVGPVAPGETADWTCTAGDEARSVRVKEWRHAGGFVHVGDVGLPLQLNERGALRVDLPAGKYEFTIVSKTGVLQRKAFEIATQTVDLGTIDLANPDDGTP